MSETDNSLFHKTRSKIILAIIFGLIPTERKLNIIRYNKLFQKKLGKDINDYIKEDSKIKIEIIPLRKKRWKIYKYINQ